jgi:hypothetical protein
MMRTTPVVPPERLRRAAFAPLWAMAVLLPLLSLLGGAWWSWRLVQAEARTRIERTTLTLREHAQRAFETQDALLAAVQRLTDGMTWEEIAASAEVAAFLRDLDAATPGAGAIGMIRPDGVMVNASSRPFPVERVDLGDRDYVRVQQDPGTAGPFVGRLIVAPLGGQIVFPYSRPRLGSDGRPDGGTLWATFRTAELGSFYARLLEHPGDAVVLVRADGGLLVQHPDPPGGPEVPLPAAGSPQLAAIRQVAEQPAAGPRLFLEGTSGWTANAPPCPDARRPTAVVIGYALHPDGPRAAWLGQVTAMAGWRARPACCCSPHLDVRRAGPGRAGRPGGRTRRRRSPADAEARLREGERLGALGQMAAGVAHDFRNLIQAMKGGVQMIRAAARGGDMARVFMVAGMVERRPRGAPP